MSNEFCPYCHSNDPDSRDHVFPQFLGGKETIDACTVCNNRVIGASVEGPASSELAWLPVMLRKVCRIPAPTYARWEKAFARDGIVYDLDTELTAVPHAPDIQRSELGWVERAIYQTRRQVEALLRSKHAMGKNYRAKEHIEKWDLSELQVQFGSSLSQRALALKLVLALGCHQNVYRLDLNEAAKLKSDFLNYAAPLVSYDFRVHSELGRFRPPLSHAIYLKVGAHPFGIVQLFSCLQFYVSLPASELLTEESCHLGVLDVVGAYKETFKRINCFPVASPEPTSASALQDGFTKWLSCFGQMMAHASGNPEVYLKSVEVQ